MIALNLMHIKKYYKYIIVRFFFFFFFLRKQVLHSTLKSIFFRQ
jgi:hypothetical protein